MDVQTCILIYYNQNWLLETCDGYVALGLLSRRESRKDLWPRLITLLLLYFMLLYFLLLLQDGGFQIYSLPFIMLHVQCRSLLASTLDKYSRLLCSLFSPFFLFFPDAATRRWTPGARGSRGWFYMEFGFEEQLGGPRQEALPLRSCCFCASLLKASLFNLCLYSNIVASVDSYVSSYVFEPSSPLACNMKLVLF